MRRSWVIAAIVGVLLVPGAKAVSAGQKGPTPTRAYTVQAGDSLWSIARSVPLDGDRRKMIHRIIELNDLRGGQIRPGQQLELPIR